jgi:outer membrane lipoprotein-sorting protein
MKKILILIVTALLHFTAGAQDIKVLLQKVKAKYDKVNDYTATGKMKTNVAFMKTPEASVKIYYKKPDRLKIKNENGVSFIPKGSVNINMNNVLGLNNYEAVEAATEKVNGADCKVVKIFPLSDDENITRATLYISEKELLVVKSVISTRENGTYELVMHYKKYAAYGLPDKVELTFNTRDYKLPKGISIDYDNGSSKQKPAADTDKNKNQKGNVEITYSDYSINKGVPDEMFK